MHEVREVIKLDSDYTYQKSNEINTNRLGRDKSSSHGASRAFVLSTIDNFRTLAQCSIHTESLSPGRSHFTNSPADEGRRATSSAGNTPAAAARVSGTSHAGVTTRSTGAGNSAGTTSRAECGLQTDRLAFAADATGRAAVTRPPPGATPARARFTPRLHFF
ncbi:jg770 [Pararge aegeria aegeria]|uniref:Jg770 protein n=1 Tax=Pararge aegeria aegeria TaxID=348720 RepID=A0A8S4S8F9_9NEOP|nr:jg770 [Pararge aegeria aegeria]